MQLINKRYEILSLIGEGEFGYIYKVKDIKDENFPLKALKLYNFDRHNELAITNFKNEFIFLKFFPLPFVPEIYEFDKVINIDGENISTNYYFYTMKYIEGKTLNHFLNSTENYQKFDNLINNIKEKIKVILTIFSRLNLHHGDLNSKNIIIEEKDNLIYFIDLEPKSTFQDDISKYKTIFSEEFNPINFNKEVFKKYNLQNFLNIILVDEIRKKIIEVVEKIEKRNKPFIINFLKTPYEIFEIIFNFIFHLNKLFYVNTYIIDLNESFENNLFIFLNQYKKQNIDYTLIEKKIKDFIENGLEKNLKDYFIFFISFFEEISFNKNIMIYFKNYDHCSNSKIEFVKNIISNISSKNCSFIFNSHKLTKFENEDFITLNPDKSLAYENYKHYLIETISKLNLMDQDLLLNLKFQEIIKFIKNISLNNKIIFEKNSLNQLISENIQIDEEILNDYDYVNLIYLFYYIRYPINLDFIKNIAIQKLNIKAEKLDFFIDYLIKIDTIFFINDNNISLNTNLYESIFYKIIENYNLKTKIIKLILNEIENNKIESENLNLFFYIIKLHILIENYSNAFNYLYKNIFKNIQFYIAQSNENIENLNKYLQINFNQIINNYDNIKQNFLYEKDENFLKLLIILWVYNSNLNFEKKESFLTKIESNNTKIIFAKYFILGRLFLINLNTKKLDYVYNELLKINDILEEDEKIFYFIFLLEYFYHKSDFHNLENIINTIIDKYEKDNDFNNNNLVYLLCKTYINYAEIFFNKKELEGYFLYNDKAKNLSEKYKIYDILVSTYINLGIYYYYEKNDNLKLKEFFNKAQILSEKFNLTNLIPRTSNNFAAISENIQEKKIYYLKALKYATYLNDKKIILVLLYNLSKYLTPFKMKLLLKKYNKYIFTFEQLDIVTNENFLLSTIAAFYTIFKIGDFENLKKYYEKLIELENPFSQNEKNKTLYFIIKNIYEINLFDLTDERIDQISENLKMLFSYNYQDIFYFALSFFINNISEDLFKKYIIILLDSISIFYSAKDKNKEETIKQIILILNNLENKNFLSTYDNKKLFEMVKIDIPILDFLALIIKTIILINKKDPLLLKYLSIANFLYNKQKLYYNKEEYIKKTSWYYIYELLKKEIENTNIKSILPKSIRESYFYNKFDFNNFEKKIINSISLDLENGLKEISKIIINELNFDRAIFYKLKLKDGLEEEIYLQKEFTLYFDENFYGSSEPSYIPENDILKTTSIIYKKYSIKKEELVESVLLIPIFDPIKVSNNIIHENKRKSTTLYLSNPFYGYLYFDKKNNIKFNYKIDNLKLLQILISNFYFSKNEEEKYLKDHLTKFYLRNVFYTKISSYLSEENLSKKQFSLLYMDIDHFKKVNDTFGHQKGDEILIKVSSIIKENIRRSDLTCRFGGEELIAVLFNVDKKGAFKIAEKIRKRIEETKLLGDKMKVTISIGIAEYPSDGKLIEEIIKKADLNLYKAKENGRNQVIYQ